MRVTSTTHLIPRHSITLIARGAVYKSRSCSIQFLHLLVLHLGPLTSK